MAVRWLHISDVHECLRDTHNRKSMFDAIVQEVKDRPAPPDLIFFTGDLAFSGQPVEYSLLKDRFLDPLRGVLPDGCPIFTVPGNHDVNRKRMVAPRIWMAADADCTLFQQVDAEGRQKRADMLLPRFQGYRTLEAELAAWGTDWLDSEDGAVCVTRDVAGHRIAIVGINTSWLCHDDHDWGNLTAGRTMVEAALNTAGRSGADLTVVLGHHPLAAMTGEQPWSDGERIRARLQQANAIYLHGHLHAAEGQKTGDSLQSVLAIQAPSGFDRGDSKVWRNGLLWGEADIDAGRLTIWPRRWNNEHRNFVFDSDAAPERIRVSGQDAYAFALPGRSAPAPVAQPAPAQPAPAQPAPEPAAPDGWQIIDAERLDAITAVLPTAQEMADWFDGTFPRWEVAAAHGVVARQIVDQQVRGFRAAYDGATSPVVRLFTGAGGEGKSAALLQTAAALIRDQAQHWTCLWRRAAGATLPQDLPAILPRRADHAWIVVVDDAETIGRELADALGRLGARTDVHVILAAREADWTLRGNSDAQWQGVTDFRTIPLRGLDEEDARRIVETWMVWGDAAMGHLRGASVDAAARVLFGHAKEFAARKEHGALLGALLITREGEDYRARVERLLVQLRGKPGIGKHSLLDIYAMIAAMHAENQLYLTPVVLAQALGCDAADLARGPLRILRQEAMLDGSDSYVLTRHRLIAEVARDWLVENDQQTGIGSYYVQLAVAAQKAYRTRLPVPDIRQWQIELPYYFVGRGNRHAAWGCAIAEALFLADSHDYHRLNTYAAILRKSGQSAAAVKLFFDNYDRFRGRRDVLNEWGVAAGGVGDYGLDIWLCARSLADDPPPLDETRAQISLNGLGSAFMELAKQQNSQDFARARAACGRLGRRLRSADEVATDSFERHAQAMPVGGTPTVEADIEIVRRAAQEASYLANPVHSQGVDAKIGEPESYRFKTLAKVLAGQSR